MFQFWFNTFFVSGLTPQPSEGEATMKTFNFDGRKQNEEGATSWFELHKEDLDKANKDKKNKIYSPIFKVRRFTFIFMSSYVAWSILGYDFLLSIDVIEWVNYMDFK